MNLRNFREGIEIISKYYDDQEGYHVGAEHDEFYLYETDNPVSDSDRSKLDELGWYHDEGDKWWTFV